MYYSVTYLYSSFIHFHFFHLFNTYHLWISGFINVMWTKKVQTLLCITSAWLIQGTLYFIIFLFWIYLSIQFTGLIWHSVIVCGSGMSDSLQPMGCSLPGSSVHRILQARLLEWVAISFSMIFSYRWSQSQYSLPVSLNYLLHS